MLAQESNELGPKGAEALAGALEKMTEMQTLGLVSGIWAGQGFVGRCGHTYARAGNRGREIYVTGKKWGLDRVEEMIAR